MRHIMRVSPELHGWEKGYANQWTLIMLIGAALLGTIFSFAVLNAGQNSAGQGKDLTNSALLQQKNTIGSSMAAIFDSDNNTDLATKAINNIQNAVESSDAMNTQYYGVPQTPAKSKLR